MRTNNRMRDYLFEMGMDTGLAAEGDGEQAAALAPDSLMRAMQQVGEHVLASIAFDGAQADNGLQAEEEEEEEEEQAAAAAE